MADKSFADRTNLGANSNDTIEHSEAIPSGARWFIESFQGGDINLGDSKSSVFVLRFDTDILDFFVFTGSSDKLLVEQEVIGDGTKKLNVLRQNKSASTKPCPFRVVIKERN